MKVNDTDGRGSEGQLRIFDIVRKIYPRYTIIWEQEINKINGRYDILVKELGIAIEVDGIQHNKYTEYFHKDGAGLVEARRADIVKDSFSVENGIKLIRLDYKTSLKIEREELSTLINSTPYPEDGSYSYECFK